MGTGFVLPRVILLEGLDFGCLYSDVCNYLISDLKRSMKGRDGVSEEEEAGKLEFEGKEKGRRRALRQ